MTKKTKSKKLVRKESHEQAAVIAWSNVMLIAEPEYGLLFAIPNGGSRHVLEAMNLKRQGVKRGVPDLFLPVARGHFHGLFIEMKSATGRLSGDQDVWLSRLALQGYDTAVCRSAHEAIMYLQDYLKLPPYWRK